MTAAVQPQGTITRSSMGTAHRSLRGDHEEHTVSEPYPDPTVETPDNWSRRSQHNWRAFMQPVYERLETDQHRDWYRRVYRPNYSTPGVQERDAVGGHNEEDFVAEIVATKVFENKEFLQPKQRRIPQMRHDEDLDAIGRAIAVAVNNAIESRPDGNIPDVPPTDRYPVDELPLTPTEALSPHRKPD